MQSIIIIGCGPGGYETASYAARHGFQVTVFEKGDLGGTCLNRGCIPTKVYCHAASVILAGERMRSLGIFKSAPAGGEQADASAQAAGAARLSFPALHAHKDDVVRQLREGVATLMAQPGITLVSGEAQLKPSADGPCVVCQGKEYRADIIILATGSHSAMPPIEGIGHPAVVTSTGLLAMDSLPARLVIIGAGVVGMEMASAYAAFGTDVTVIEFMRECLPQMDSDLAKRLRKLLMKRGVKFYLQAAAKRISDNDGAASVVFEQKGKELTVEADTVLVATGRRPNTDGLGLDDMGIAHDKRGISVDEHFQTTVPGIYAIGDVNGRVMLAHAAEYQGRQIISQLVGHRRHFRHDFIPSAVFTTPELGAVGPTEEQLKAAGHVYHCRKSFYRANGKAVATDATDGLVKLITDANDHIIACHVLGDHAADIVQEATALIGLGADIADLHSIVHIHPTVEEMLK